MLLCLTNLDPLYPLCVRHNPVYHGKWQVLTFELAVELVVFLVELVEGVGGFVVVHPQRCGRVVWVRDTCNTAEKNDSMQVPV